MWFIWALLCLLLASSQPGYAQGTLPLLGAGKSSAGGGNPTLVYVGTVTPTTAGLVATATNAATGGAGYTVVVIHDAGASGSGYSGGCTIGASGTMTTVNEGVAINALVSIQGLTTPGGTQTITCTATGGTGPNGPLFYIYTITNLNSTTATGSCNNTNASASALTCTTGFNTTSGGVAIMASLQNTNSSACPGSCSISGSETYSIDASPHSGGFSQGTMAHAGPVSTNTPSSVTYTWNAAAQSAIVAAAWK